MHYNVYIKELDVDAEPMRWGKFWIWKASFLDREDARDYAMQFRQWAHYRARVMPGDRLPK